MIHELVGIRHNAVDLTGLPDIPDDLRQVAVSANNDDFFRSS
jgi:hypothetical protein